MRSYFFVLVSLLLFVSACTHDVILPMCDAEDRLESSAPICNPAIEKAMASLYAQAEGLTGLHQFPVGSKTGTVEEVDGDRLVVKMGRDVSSLTWPDPLPFPIVPGELVVVETDMDSTTLRFQEGSLWVHSASAYSRPSSFLQLGTLEISFQEGCRSSRGPTLDPVVVDSSGKAFVVVPGQTVEADGWTFKNFGTTSSPGSAACNVVAEGHYFSQWIAYRLDDGALDCKRWYTSPPPCSAEIGEAVEAARGYTVGKGLHKVDGTFVVSDMSETSLTLLAEETREELVFHWPEPLPASIEVGHSVSIENTQEWTVLRTSEKILAVSHGIAFVLPHPYSTPDQAVAIDRHDDGCGVPHQVHPDVSLRDGSESFVLSPGQSQEIGGWVIRYVSGTEVSGVECTQNGRLVSIGEGMGSATFTAVQDVSPPAP